LETLDKSIEPISNDLDIVEPKPSLILTSLVSPSFTGRYFAENVNVESGSP